DDLIADDPSDYPKYGEVIKYRFLFRPPLSILYDEPDPITGKTSDSFEVNYGVLCIQWAVVGLVTGFIIVKSKNKKKQGDIMMTDKEIENKSIELIRIVN
ncbi:MAG: hypothetical protein GWN62_22600, partial [Aliifodinibius sp.]|nr:hypothetical protein [Fodinibius sp.]